MYWIYLIIFTFIVFIPSLVRHTFFSLSLIQVQEYAILLLGILAYILFYFQQKKIRIMKQDKTLMQSEANRMTKDLTSSYTYIGEINRKLEILKKMVTQYPEDMGDFDASREKELYAPVLETIQVLTKTPNVAIRFLDKKGQSLKEIKKNKKSKFTSIEGWHCEKQQSACENDSLVMICSQSNNKGIVACILISKEGTGFHKIDDYEIFKALATHALFLYMVSAGRQKID